MPVTGGTKEKKKKKDEIWGEQTLLQLQLNKNLQLSYGALTLIEQQKYKEKKKIRHQHYRHPQPSPGFACRHRRWSGLIPSNKPESSHLFSSAAFTAAQWQHPHLSSLKDNSTVKTFHCASRIFEREIKLKYFSIKHKMCLGTQLLSILNLQGFMELVTWWGNLGEDRTKMDKPEEPFLPWNPVPELSGRLKESHWSSPFCCASLPSDAPKSQQDLKGHSASASTRDLRNRLWAQTQPWVGCQKKGIYKSPVLARGCPDTTNTYLTMPFYPGLPWGLKSAGKIPADLVLISTPSAETPWLSLL